MVRAEFIDYIHEPREELVPVLLIFVKEKSVQTIYKVSNCLMVGRRVKAPKFFLEFGELRTVLHGLPYNLHDGIAKL